MKTFFKIILLTLLLSTSFQTSLIAVEEKKIENEDELKKKLDTLKWYNWDNPSEHKVLLEEADAEILVMESEYYLRGKKDINQYTWWTLGYEELDSILTIFGDGYTVYVKYFDEGYVTLDDWRSQDTNVWLNEMREIQKSWVEKLKKQKANYIENLNWVNKPEFSQEKRYVNYSYEVFWNGEDGNYKGLESTTLVLGRKGYLDITFVTKIKPDTDLKVLANVSKEFADGIQFKEGSKHSDYKSGDKIAAVGIGGLVAGSLGVKALAKAGVLAKFLPLLAKFWWIILAPIVAIFGFAKSGRKRKK